MSVFLRQNKSSFKFSSSESWVILTSIEQGIKGKIEQIGKPLKDWKINIYRGVLTGYNEAFIIDGQKKNELVSADPKSAEIIRPILRGRDIRKYGYEFANQWIINAHNGIKEKAIKPINIEDYPVVKRHFDRFYIELAKRTDKGDTAYNLRNCAYMDDFSKQKIVWGEISDRTKFAIDFDGFFVPEATTFVMTGESLLYLLGYLNSKFSEYLFAQIGTTTGVGTVRWKKFTIEKLLVPKIPSALEIIFSEIVIDLIQDQEADSVTRPLLLKKLDYLIYEYLHFTNDEIEIIENFRLSNNSLPT